MKIEKTNPNAAMFPECQDCPNRIVQTDWVDPEEFSYVAGCKLMGAKDWERGSRFGPGNIMHQRNCPLKEHTK